MFNNWRPRDWRGIARSARLRRKNGSTVRFAIVLKGIELSLDEETNNDN